MLVGVLVDMRSMLMWINDVSTVYGVVILRHATPIVQFGAKTRSNCIETTTTELRKAN